jgi:beta-N-acetylhexosaminidase
MTCREPEMLAAAAMSRRYVPRRHAQRHGGPSAGTVIGILVVAVSLVGVGALVTLNSLTQGGSPGPAGPAPTPTAGRGTPSTPIVATVGPRGQAPESGTTPGASGSSMPDLNTPNTVGGPIVGAEGPRFTPPQPSPDGSPTPAVEPAAGASPDASPPAPTAPEPLPNPPASAPSGSPSTGQPTVEQAAADALARLATNEEKVGQLLMLAWIGSTAEEARPALRDLKAGAIVHVQNTSSSDGAAAINRDLRRIARESGTLPPLISIDHEGGNVQRIRDIINLGSNWEFAQSGGKESEACQRGARHAQILREMGFSMNLAPVLDVNNNPANPVIGRRSFSDDPQVVARLGAAYIRGLQNGGIAAVGKHFPGHGNTSVDSHLGLPSLPMTVAQLEQIELVPFKRAIDVNIAGIMSAHIVFPAVDPSGSPATLSRAVMHGLLRERLGYQGLVVSDDMGAMRAITDNFAPGDAAVRAIQAGVDLIILSAEYGRQQQSRDAILAAVQDGRIPQERLNQAVMNVLLVKAQYGVLSGTVAPAGGVCP